MATTSTSRRPWWMTELRRYAEGANKPHYHVLEIFLPVDNPEQNDKVKKDAEEVERQLHQGAPLPRWWRASSASIPPPPPAATWAGSIPASWRRNWTPRSPRWTRARISDPIRSTGGWYVLGLRERQEPLGTKIADVPTGPTGPAGTLPLARLLFPVGPRPPKDQLEQIMTVANQIQQHYVGCGQLDELHNKMTGTVYMDLGDAKLDRPEPADPGSDEEHPVRAKPPRLSCRKPASS